MFDDGGHRQSQVLAAPAGRHRRVQLREALHVQLIDQRIAPGVGGRPVAAPIEAAVDHARARRTLAGELARIRIDQCHRGVEAVAVLGLVRTVHMEPIVGARPGASRRQQAVPHIAGACRQIAAQGRGAALRIEQAQLYARGVARKQREIDAVLVPLGTQGMRRARLNDRHYAGPMKNSAPSGGRSSRSEYGYPCAPCRTAWVADCRLYPDPPNAAWSESNSLRYSPAPATPMP